MSGYTKITDLLSHMATMTGLGYKRVRNVLRKYISCPVTQQRFTQKSCRVRLVSIRVSPDRREEVMLIHAGAENQLATMAERYEFDCTPIDLKQGEKLREFYRQLTERHINGSLLTQIRQNRA